MNKNIHNILISYLILFFGLFMNVKAYGTSGVSGDSNAKIRIYENQGGDFTLIGPDREEVSSLKFCGNVFLIYFGYTYCPDV